MTPEALTLTELCAFDRTARPWRVDIIAREIGGGRLTLSDLVAIDEQPDATALSISGLDQPTFEALVVAYGRRFTAIHFWKCPRIADLSPLEGLPNLTHVAFYWNQRVSRLWDFARTPRLQGLQFDDFTRLRDLSALAAATSVTELRFGNAIWRKAVFATLEPLGALVNLKSLSFDAKRIDDDRVQPLARLQRLESLTFPANQFTIRQVAWLRARLPESLQSRSLEPLWTIDPPLHGATGLARDTLLVGRGKPFANSIVAAKRIAKHVDEFWRMVDEFRRDPVLEP